MEYTEVRKHTALSLIPVKINVLLVFLIMVLGHNNAFAQFTETFEGSVPNTGWTISTPGVKSWDKSTAGNGHAGNYSLRCDNAVGVDDTWLFTPVQALTAGTTYSFNFWVRVSAYTTPQKLKITVGSAATIAGQTTTLWDCNNGTALTSNCWEWVNCRFTPTVSGNYYFALNCYSASNAGVLYVDDVKLEAGCSSPLSGTINVGSGQTYTSLTKAGGLFQKINSCGLSGNLTVNITSDLSEDGTYCISDWKNTSYSVTIQPDAAVVRTISGSNANGLIRINGADKMIINGNFAGSGQYLCIRNTNLSSQSSKVIGFRENSANCAIRNCRILNGYYGIHQSDQADAFNTIANCSIEDFSNVGVLLYGGNNTTISANSIFHTTRSTQPGAVWGIYTNNATSVKIEKNKIYNLTPYCDISDPYWTIYYDAIGIEIGSLSGGVAVTASIKNNMINLSEHGARWLKGIIFSANIAGSSCDVCFNSVYIGGATLNTSEYDASISGGYLVPVSYCIYKSNGYTFNCYNNIMYNNRTSAVAARKNYAFQVTNTSNISSNYNDLYAPQANGYVGLWGATDYSTIAAWRTASGQDANSFNQDPSFINTATSPFDLHIQANMGLKGTMTCSPGDDFDSEARIAPTIGADEIPITLPVQLLWFNASCDDNKVKLSWATASETNNSRFIIERSNDGFVWEIISQVSGSGNSNSLMFYNTDVEQGNPDDYYRLTQIDFDGKTESFAPVKPNCGESSPEINCYPNPFSDELLIGIQNMQTTTAELSIFDITGRIVYEINLNAENLVNDCFKADVSHLSEGVYTVRVNCGTYSNIMRIIKN